MENRNAMRALALILLVLAACNLPQAGSAPGASSPAAAEGPGEGAAPSGLPTLTLESGSGYLFETQEVVHGSDPRDIWWNGVGFVPGTLMGSLGSLDSPQAVDQVSQSILAFKQFDPLPGEAYLVEVAAAGQYAIIRYLFRGDQAQITFEVLYPFAGRILP